ncbi:MAG: hypothetical protein GY711_21620 [bacterium]|nr:hypothetical protein [bacterium]
MNLFRTALLSAALAPCGAGQILWSQSVDPTHLLAGNSVACQSTGSTADNGYWRSYDPVTCGYPVGEDFEILQVVIGVEAAVAGGGAGVQPVHVRIYYNGTGGPPDPSASLQLAAETLLVSDQALSFETLTLSTPVLVCNGGGTIDVEIDVPDAFAQGTGDFFLIGSNGSGETAPGYLRTSACGVPVPLELPQLGYTSLHLAIDLVVQDDPRSAIGVNYCTSEPNSTGRRGGMRAYGSIVATDNDVTLEVCGLPANQFGYFIASSMSGFIQRPGNSSGNFCLAAGPTLGRYDSLIQNSGVTGSFEIPIDLTAIPINVVPNTVSMTSGDVWYFQSWYRDVGGTSNFTDAIELAFQ